MILTQLEGKVAPEQWDTLKQGFHTACQQLPSAIVPHSSTGDLKGLRGTGSYSLVGHQERFPLMLDYDFT
jgi:hypothetical protein